MIFIYSIRELTLTKIRLLNCPIRYPRSKPPYLQVPLQPLFYGLVAGVPKCEKRQFNVQLEVDKENSSSYQVWGKAAILYDVKSEDFHS